MSRHFAEILILIPTTLEAGFLLAVSGVIQKVMNDLDEGTFKVFLTRLEYRAMRSPFALSVSLLTTIAALPYWFFFGLSNWWFTAGLVLWFVGSTISKILNTPIYKRVKEVDGSQTAELKQERTKLQTANEIRAWLTLASVVLMIVALA
jgi:hypothetical protein